MKTTNVLLLVVVIILVSLFSSFKKNEVIADQIELKNLLRNEIVAKDNLIEALNIRIKSDEEYQEALKNRIKQLEKEVI